MGDRLDWLREQREAKAWRLHPARTPRPQHRNQTTAQNRKAAARLLKNDPERMPPPKLGRRRRVKPRSYVQPKGNNLVRVKVAQDRNFKGR